MNALSCALLAAILCAAAQTARAVDTKCFSCGQVNKAACPPNPPGNLSCNADNKEECQLAFGEIVDCPKLCVLLKGSGKVERGCYTGKDGNGYKSLTYNGIQTEEWRCSVHYCNGATAGGLSMFAVVAAAMMSYVARQ